MDETHLIRQAVCKHMPTAAIASGFIAPVAELYAVEIDRLSDRFPPDSYARFLGLTNLRDHLRLFGEPTTVWLAIALQKSWNREAIQRHNFKGVFPDHLPLSQRTQWLRDEFAKSMEKV